MSKHSSNSEKVDVEVEVSVQSAQAESTEETEGGYGWVIVFCSFVVNFLALGIESTWGIYQDYYLSSEILGPSNNLRLAWVGAIQAVGVSIFGLPAGKLSEMIGHRWTGIIGSLALGLSLITASFSKDVWHLYLNQGALFAIGSAFMVIPALTIPSQWFVKRRGLTTGIGVSGYGVGGLVLSPVTRKLIDEVGVRWALRIMGILTVVLCVIAFAFMKPRDVKRQASSSTTSLTLSQILKDGKFYAVYAFMFLHIFGYYIPTFYNPEYARVRLHRDGTDSATTLAIQAGLSAIGRVLAGWLSDYVGPILALTVCQVLSGIAQMVYWPFCDSFASVSGFAAVYGFFSGGIVSLSPVFLAEIYGAERLPSIFGLALSGTIPGTLAGPSIAGAIIDANTSPDGSINFVPVQLYGGSWLIAGALVTFGIGAKRYYNRAKSSASAE
ncbi:hypothetical protein VNI00_006498 [Paramarasmius palmivorus]|uniref:Major facilitator superfamily (MFS) profile domain-containing protein n=1 Tax=Paramarasmius palmivorus TaxID=297713 RepID=A0AAW0D8C8_9AGAR